MGKVRAGGRDDSSTEHRGSRREGHQKSEDEARPEEEQDPCPKQGSDCGEKVPSSLWLLSTIYPSSVSVFGSLDGRETEGAEKPEDKAYNSLRILPRPVLHSGRLRP